MVASHLCDFCEILSCCKDFSMSQLEEDVVEFFIYIC